MHQLLLWLHGLTGVAWRGLCDVFIPRLPSTCTTARAEPGRGSLLPHQCDVQAPDVFVSPSHVSLACSETSCQRASEVLLKSKEMALCCAPKAVSQSRRRIHWLLNPAARYFPPSTVLSPREKRPWSFAGINGDCVMQWLPGHGAWCGAHRGECRSLVQSLVPGAGRQALCRLVRMTLPVVSHRTVVLVAV